MKKIITAILIVIISFIFVVPIISRFFISQLAQSKAQELLKTKVTLSSAEIHFLTSTIVLNDFKIFHPDRPDAADGEIASIQYLKLTANPLLLVFKKEISINLKIISPKFHYTLTPNGIWELSGRFPLLNRGKNEKRMTPFNVEKIDISDGDIIYEDQFVSNPATSTHLSDIDVLIKNLQLPAQDNPLPTQFEASMDIEEDGLFHMEGTGDFLSPKINFTSEVTLKNISLQKFSPYYQSDLPVILQKGFLQLTSQAICKNDFLKAPAHVSIHDLVVTKKADRISGFAADTVLDTLKNKSGSLELDILISGPIRNPQFHITTSLSQAFSKGLTSGLIQGIPDALQDIGRGVGDTIHSGFGKLKGLFH